jgi:hypothetical protein
MQRERGRGGCSQPADNGFSTRPPAQPSASLSPGSAQRLAQPWLSSAPAPSPARPGPGRPGPGLGCARGWAGLGVAGGGAEGVSRKGRAARADPPGDLPWAFSGLGRGASPLSGLVQGGSGAGGSHPGSCSAAHLRAGPGSWGHVPATLPRPGQTRAGGGDLGRTGLGLAWAVLGARGGARPVPQRSRCARRPPAIFRARSRGWAAGLRLCLAWSKAVPAQRSHPRARPRAGLGAGGGLGGTWPGLCLWPGRLGAGRGGVGRGRAQGGGCGWGLGWFPVSRKGRAARAVLPRLSVRVLGLGRGASPLPGLVQGGSGAGQPPPALAPQRTSAQAQAPGATSPPPSPGQARPDQARPGLGEEIWDRTGLGLAWAVLGSGRGSGLGVGGWGWGTPLSRKGRAARAEPRRSSVRVLGVGPRGFASTSPGPGQLWRGGQQPRLLLRGAAPAPPASGCPKLDPEPGLEREEVLAAPGLAWAALGAGQGSGPRLGAGAGWEEPWPWPWPGPGREARAERGRRGYGRLRRA